MIRELIEYCLTPASRNARHNGYLYEAMAFESRGRRNQKHWQPHWDHCQKLVKDFVESHPSAQSIAILGSGCLFEIPKEDLIKKGLRLVLVDQVFPRSVRSWARSHATSVEMREMDVSENSFSNFDCDLVLSANLISQLILPKRHHLRRAEVQENHFKCLRELKVPSLAWTDVERLYLEKKTGALVEAEPTVFCSLPEKSSEWKWNLAPAPEWHRDVDLVLKMQSFVY